MLSDHGQSQGETFLDRYGETLEAVVTRPARRPTSAPREAASDEALAYLSAGLTEVARDDTSPAARPAR